MSPVIFFDMDGLLCDFVRGVLRHHGREDFPYSDVRWGIEAQLGIEPGQFWDGLGHGFWANLDTLADGFRLLRWAEHAVGADAVGILSSPCDTAGCAEGKREWILRHLPTYKKRLFLGSAKELFAGPAKLLIDDHDPNCDRFAAAGGKAVLVPRPWNERRGECDPDGGFPFGRVVDDVLAALKP